MSRHSEDRVGVIFCGSIMVLAFWKIIDLVTWGFNTGVGMSEISALILGLTVIILAILFGVGWWLNMTEAFKYRATKNTLRAKEAYRLYEERKVLEIENKANK